MATVTNPEIPVPVTIMPVSMVPELLVRLIEVLSVTTVETSAVAAATETFNSEAPLLLLGSQLVLDLLLASTIAGVMGRSII